MPLSTSSCLTQVIRVRPWVRVQSGIALVPEHISKLSLKAMWAGTSAGSLLMCPKREWRHPAMMSLMSARSVLSETVTFPSRSIVPRAVNVGISCERPAVSPHPLWVAFKSSSHTTGQVGHTSCRCKAWMINGVAYCSTPYRVAPL